jgi:hypothetical protein
VAVLGSGGTSMQVTVMRGDKTVTVVDVLRGACCC